MTSPLFSIVVPIFNSEQYLSRCLESIIAQTENSFELILVDDGSSDTSGLICDHYCNLYDNVKVIHKNNQGKSAALNDGLRISSGEYWLIIDSDDYIDIDFLEKYKDCIGIYHPEIIISNYYLEPSSQKVETHFCTECCVSGFELVKTNAVANTSNDVCFSWRMVFFREFLLNNNLFTNVDIVFGEDTDYNLRALCVSKKAVAIEYAGYHYVINENSLMRQKYKKELLPSLNYQYLSRQKFYSIVQFRDDAACYYIESILFLVVNNILNNPNGFEKKDFKSLIVSDWLKDSFKILGNRLFSVSKNKKTFCLLLLFKYRLTDLIFLYYKRRYSKQKK